MDVLKSVAEGWFSMAQVIPFPHPVCSPQTRCKPEMVCTLLHHDTICLLADLCSVI